MRPFYSIMIVMLCSKTLPLNMANLTFLGKVRMRDATSAKHGSFHASLAWSKHQMDYTFHINLAFETDFNECQLASRVAGSGHIWSVQPSTGTPPSWSFQPLMPGLLLTTVECCRGTTTLDLTNGRITEIRWVSGGYFEDVCVPCCCVIWRRVHRAISKNMKLSCVKILVFHGFAPTHGIREG